MEIGQLFQRTLRKLFPLTTQSLSFSYQEQEVLKNINLKIKEGQITAVIGKSGSGKSTFLKLVSGIITRKYKGKISIFGSTRFLGKDHIGFVPQEIAIIPDLSIEDNLRIAGLSLGLSERKALKKGSQLMELLQLHENMKKLPSQLSGGQRVRLNIVLSLLHEPKLIIMDEPFVGLDFANRRLLWHFIEAQKKKGKAIILTSHLLTETQEHADRLVILKDGKVFFTGKLEALKKKLKITWISEVRFSHLSKEAEEKIRKYCMYKDIKILEHFGKYLMLAIPTTRLRTALYNMMDKSKLAYEEISVREPNLDEIFMNA